MFRASSMPSQVRSQLFMLAAKRIEELEREVLEQLDGLVPQCRAKPLQADNALMVGLCIRRLSLYYRRTMLRYKQFNKGTSPSSRTFTPTNSKCDLEQEIRKLNAQNMYDMMIRLYCRVFRVDLSPFHHQWRMSKHGVALRGDKSLIALFERFKDAEAVHCKL